MNILAIDTSGPTAGAAVLRGGEIAAEIFLNNGLTHSQTIMPAVEQALEAAGLEPRELELVACVVGPGSFTGVRIGACAARGMAHAIGVPCAAIDALAAIAHGAFGFEGWVCPMLNARRGQVYAAAFRQGERALPDEALPLESFFDKLPGEGKLLFAGEAAPMYAREIRERFGERAAVAPAHLLHVRPAAAADLAGRMRPEEYVSADRLLPLYLRAPQAERERAAKLAAQGQ